ncbi:hypothetical protein AAMO2058_001271200 [Amorphochlora amoebiformis]
MINPVFVALAVALMMTRGWSTPQSALKPNRRLREYMTGVRGGRSDNDTHPHSPSSIGPPQNLGTKTPVSSQTPGVSGSLLRLGYSAVSSGVSKVVDYLSPTVSVGPREEDNFSYAPSPPRPDGENLPQSGTLQPQPLEITPEYQQQYQTPQADAYAGTPTPPPHRTRVDLKTPVREESVEAGRTDGSLLRKLFSRVGSPYPSNPNPNPNPLPPHMAFTPPPPSPTCEMACDAQDPVDSVNTISRYSHARTLQVQHAHQGRMAVAVGLLILMRAQFLAAWLKLWARVKGWGALDQAALVTLLVGSAMLSPPFLLPITAPATYAIHRVSMVFEWIVQSIGGRLFGYGDGLRDWADGSSVGEIAGKLRISDIRETTISPYRFRSRKPRLPPPQPLEEEIEGEIEIEEEIEDFGFTIDPMIPLPSDFSLSIDSECPSIGVKDALSAARGDEGSENFDVIINTTFPIPASKMWATFFGDTARYSMSSFHIHHQKDTGLSYTLWLPSPPHPPNGVPLGTENNNEIPTREFEFTTEFRSRLGPPTALVQKTQRLLQIGEDGFYIEASSVIPEVPYGQSFAALVLWSVTNTDEENCRVIVRVKTEFTKSVWVAAGMIRHMVRTSSAEWYEQFIESAKIYLEQNPLPVKPKPQLKPALSEKGKTVDGKKPSEAERIPPKGRVYIMGYDSTVGPLELAKLVNYLIPKAEAGDRVLIRIRSSGEGWAEAASVASELSRLRKRAKFTLISSIDSELRGPMFLTVAALSDVILAAPYAVVATPPPPPPRQSSLPGFPDGGSVRSMLERLNPNDDPSYTISHSLWRAAAARRPSLRRGAGCAKVGFDAAADLWVDNVDTSDGYIINLMEMEDAEKVIGLSGGRSPAQSINPDRDRDRDRDASAPPGRIDGRD